MLGTSRAALAATKYAVRHEWRISHSLFGTIEQSARDGATTKTVRRASKTRAARVARPDTMKRPREHAGPSSVTRRRTRVKSPPATSRARIDATSHDPKRPNAAA